ncbi:potassium channel family protein [Clostridium novyi]|uniref:potassium channel family protein n=1 Tax=Clostridium novyi TaxID=1542 RepID=UPI0004D5F308|nr:potassium channel family protein [Clostridium novyi]KEH87202.1 potassium channel protein [Clostridium novyi A str. 4540]KEH93185.1 potassium channel protein [Clostridium novyi A str. GD211209]
MNKREIYYEISMALLSLFVVIMSLVDLILNLSPKERYIFNIIDNFIWIVFILDYVIRFFKSHCKIKFIFNNKIDLVCILPFNPLFKGLKMYNMGKVIRISKLTKIVKATVFLSKFKKKASAFIKTNNFNYALTITIIVVIIGAYSITFVEKMEFKDALWWSFVTATTVGYGDISPKTGLGRIIAVILTIIGISFISMLTGTIATYCLNKRKFRRSYKRIIIEDIKDKLDNFENLTNDDIKNMFDVLITLKRDNTIK